MLPPPSRPSTVKAGSCKRTAHARCRKNCGTVSFSPAATLDRVGKLGSWLGRGEYGQLLVDGAFWNNSGFTHSEQEAFEKFSGFGTTVKNYDFSWGYGGRIGQGYGVVNDPVSREESNAWRRSGTNGII